MISLSLTRRSIAPDDLSFDFDFCNAKFHWFRALSDVRFDWLGRKYHCLERILRKSVWIKKSIIKIPLICRINFEKYFIKAIENFFPVFA